MWVIYEEKSFSRKVRKIPKPILKRYEVWKRIVELEGPKGLPRIKGFHDEALRGEWRGYRSSRLNQQCRVMYGVQCREIYVTDLNAHEYKRR